MNNSPVLYAVVPCYNEEQVIAETAKQLSEKIKKMTDENLISAKSRILFVDDGSCDNTWAKLCDIFSENPLVCAIKLTANRGHQNALLAGLMCAKEYCDCAVSLDADLQDDIDVLDEFVQKYNNGCEVVYGVRSERKSDTAFKRNTAQIYYKLLKLLGVEIVYNHADYRLLGKSALGTLSEYRETNLFLRGIIPLMGYKSDTVYYKRKERFAGKTKYPFKKMLSFAFDGITSFSIKPIKIIGNMGFLISVCSIFAMLYALISKFTGNAVAGWTATVASIWLIGGIQLLSLGVIGTYIGKIYSEVKQRPKYTVETFLKK